MTASPPARHDAPIARARRALRSLALVAAAAATAGGAVAGGESDDPLAAIAGVDWRLVEMGGAPAPSDPRPVTLRYEDGRVAGFGGCNRYFAGVEHGASAGAVGIGPAGATRMACPQPQMSVEDRFLAALTSTRAARVEDGGARLVLEGVGDGPLVFERAAP